MKNDILINCDLGEHSKDIGGSRDADLMDFVDMANIACGFHAGDEYTIKKSIERAQKRNLKIGLHPSYNDRENFGRKQMSISKNELRDLLIWQWELFYAISESMQADIYHIKPHGALYHALCWEEQSAEVFMEFMQSLDSQIRILGFSGCHLESLCMQENLHFIRENFADRRYENGRLVSRQKSNAMLSNRDEIESQLRKFQKEEKTDSVCVHGDGQNALDILRITKSYLNSDKG